ncbi:DUF4407 domain-containing protein [Halpernia frigidisoli]|uniref:DUF4407 domain-containing protein n=1 Tax=Halpernia frigidisoli TaxID=1125876 RepID=A0A1I3HHH8_9FLAO|nr:DUF4407 domain-containing protein [Halpernia frigidisoli]SFI35037.1 protein of unknown function [Halpernia frigidisoli]
MKEKNSLRNFFLKFSGEDFQIINRSGTSNVFVGIGVFVFMIFILCCVSGFSFLYNAFQGNIFLSVPIGIFWGLLVAVIYVFLNYTITPTLLPTPIKKNNKIIGEVKMLVFNYNISFFFRLGFIIFLAVIVSQPLNVLLLKNSSQRSVDRYKIEYKLNEVLSADSSFVKKEMEYRSKFEERFKILSLQDSVNLKKSYSVISQKIENDNISLINGLFFKKDLEKLKRLPFSGKNQQKFDDIYSNIENLLFDETTEDQKFLENIKEIKFNNQYLEKDFQEYKNNVVSVIQEKKEHYEKLAKLVDKSNFYITTMRIILKENPLSWAVISFAVFTFIFPVYQKYSVGKKKSFFKMKQEIEMNFVQNNYNEHVKKYGITLQKRLEKLNQDLVNNLSEEMKKLEKYDVLKYERVRTENEKEVADIFAEKYQFWKNPPFRTKKTESIIVHKSEKDFLDFIHHSES